MDGKAEAYGTVWSVVVCVVGVVELVVLMGVSMVVSAWGVSFRFWVVSFWSGFWGSGWLLGLSVLALFLLWDLCGMFLKCKARTTLLTPPVTQKHFETYLENHLRKHFNTSNY